EAAPSSEARSGQLGGALDAIRERFGAGAIRRAVEAPRKITHSGQIKAGEQGAVVRAEVLPQRVAVLDPDAVDADQEPDALATDALRDDDVAGDHLDADHHGG